MQIDTGLVHKEEYRELVRQLKKIEIRTNALVEGLQPGLHHSLFKGRGMEFSEIREYVPGDDIRTIDWNVTARYNRPFVKEFTEERDQTFYFLCDISGSAQFGSAVTKQKKTLEVLASLAFAALRNNDRIGLCLFTDRVEKFIPARRGRKHLVSLLDILITYRPQSKATSISEAARYVVRAIPRKSSVIIISDFSSPEFFRALAILRERHEVIAIRITDQRERELPAIGLVQFEDPETGAQVLVDTSDAGFRKRYAILAEQEDQKNRTSFLRAGIRNVELSTDERYDIPLRQFFRDRTRGRR